MDGIGGAAWLDRSVRTVRMDELEARLVVEAEGRMKLARRLFGFWSSLSFSLVARDDVDTIDSRFARLRSLFPSSASSLPLMDSFSFPSSLEEVETEGLGTRTPMVPMEIVDDGDEDGEREGVSAS